MKLFNPFLFLTFWLFQTSHAETLEPPFEAQAQIVLAEWFSIDPKHDIQMQKKPVSDDALGQRFQLTFISDDQQAVNGSLVLPAKPQQVKKVALLLHPMGRSENIWWTPDNPIQGEAISTRLLQQGFALLTLDARRHGQRKLDDMGLKEMLNRAHSPHRRQYDDMIIGSVRDYRLALSWLRTELFEPTTTLVIGYSMGAQMSLLLASFENTITHVMAMVPPYVDQPASPVAPRQHVKRISDAHVLLLTAKQDPYATQQQNQYVYDLIGSVKKQLIAFDSGHLLPAEYLQQALAFIETISGANND
ncbi:alpha/beta hydrolase [Marinicella sp. W31]|uniref:alpha/beta hydrolase n=1 Tax=Marinicella sp. W31 TaxID=3023713 RepID=UPI0037578B38